MKNFLHLPYKRLLVSLYILGICSTIFAVDIASFRYSLVDQERLAASQNVGTGIGISRVEFEVYQESTRVQAIGTVETEYAIDILVPELGSYVEAVASASDVFNFPNPFRLSDGTLIGYTLSKDMDVQLRLYNMFGQLVYAAEYDEGTNGGTGTPYYNKVEFDRTYLSGNSLAAGVYFYILVNNGDVIGKGKMAIIP